VGCAGSALPEIPRLALFVGIALTAVRCRAPALFAPEIPLLRLGRELAELLVERMCVLGSTKSLRERDVARAGDIATAALDALVEPEDVELRMSARACRDQEVLRLEADRARARAIAAPDARPFRIVLADLFSRSRTDAVRALRNR
jgi:hypothetical protein